MLRSERPGATGYDRVCSVVTWTREIQIRWLISNKGSRKLTCPLKNGGWKATFLNDMACF